MSDTELIMDWDARHSRLLWTVWSGPRSRARGVIFVPLGTDPQTVFDFARDRTHAWERRAWTRIGPHDFLRWAGRYPLAVRELHPDGSIGQRVSRDRYLLWAFSARPPVPMLGYVIRGGGVRPEDGWVAAARGRGADWVAVRLQKGGRCEVAS